jgi:hypothetical protein
MISLRTPLYSTPDLEGELSRRLTSLLHEEVVLPFVKAGEVWIDSKGRPTAALQHFLLTQIEAYQNLNPDLCRTYIYALSYVLEDLDMQDIDSCMSWLHFAIEQFHTDDLDAREHVLLILSNYYEEHKQFELALRYNKEVMQICKNRRAGLL